MQYPWVVWRTDVSKPTVARRCLRGSGGQKSFTALLETKSEHPV
jgi:hypothetical protein